MINKKNVFIVIMVVLLSSSAFAQIPSPLKDVKVTGAVILDSTTGIYTYSYQIFNPHSNDGKIFSFEIDITKPLNSQELNSKGLIILKRMKAQGALTRSFEEEIASRLMEKSVIPVGAQPPLGQPFPGWSAAIAVMGTVSWGGSEQNLILPNQTLEGFILTSYGLPGIRNVVVEPDYVVKEEDIPEDVDNLYNYLDKIYSSIAFKGKTIGPTSPPADFKPIDFLNYIIDLKHQVASLGWITNKGIENSLDQKLENAKKKIEQGNITPAKNMLNAFINEVEAQNGKHLTSEAYGLLKYNVQYLIEKLK